MDEMVLNFFMPMKPPTVTHQEKKVAVRSGKPVVYEDDRLKDARKKLMAYLSAHRPREPLTGPIRLIARWYFPDERCAYKHGQYRYTKPDTDNIEKLLKDCMTACHYWKDDAQVSSELVEKFWVREKPGIYIEVHALERV